jgi:pimeloyl-ACP methyl ester carboxylesterase
MDCGPSRRDGSIPGLEAPRFDRLLSISKRGFHRVAYTEWGDPASARVAVCVHGLSRQGRDFDPLARALARKGYRVVCPDLAGRGRSDWLADADDYAMPQYCVDMTALIARLGVESVDWVGTSLGGLVGMILAGQDRSPIRRLVINDIGPYLPWNTLFRIGVNVRAAPREFPSLGAVEAHFRTALAAFGDLSDAEWRHLAEHSVERGPDGRFHVLFDPGIARPFQPGLLYNLSLWRYWDAIRCPVLLLRGEYSDLLLEDSAAEMARRNRNAELVEMPGCGHAPALLDEDQVSLVADWVARAP